MTGCPSVLKTPRSSSDSDVRVSPLMADFGGYTLTVRAYDEDSEESSIREIDSI